MNYTCTLNSKELVCTLTSDVMLRKPVFCCALMAPITVISGGEIVYCMGGYSEIELPDLLPGELHEFDFVYTDGFTPANRAWMPIGPYLRVDGKCILLPPTKRGFKDSPKDPTNKPTPVSNTIRLVPQPVQWAPSGEYVLINSVRIDGSREEKAPLQAVANLAERRQFKALLSPTGIPLTLQHETQVDDGYRIDISPNSIVISASSYGGRFYAGITLLTLIKNYDARLPCGTIKDEPRFDWRGQHLDTARHYYQPKTILDLLDLMALVKLNRFHWHFADDEAFRLQVDCCPELWMHTEIRGEGHLLPALFSGEIETGGSYSKDDARKIIAHAKSLNIEILPEIETPAHALALAKVYPETRDPIDTGTEISVQGYTSNILNPAMPKTWEILNNIVTEVGELFPFNHIHLGCDELPEHTWSGSPKAQSLMESEGLQTTDDLLGWTISKLARTVVENGQRPAAWEEAARGSNGGIGHNAILFSWTAQGPGLDAARSGYDVVMCPAQHVYLDMAHSADANDWGASWAAFISLADTIAWNVIPDESVADNIIGVQGAYWSEFTTSDEQIWPMLLPRILGVATKAWQTSDIDAHTLTALAEYYRHQDLSLA